MTAAHQRVVLDQSVTRDDIDEAMGRSGWQLTNVVPPSAERPGQLVFASRDVKTVIYMVDDTRLGVTYFAVTGDGADEELAAIRERLAVDDLVRVPDLLADPSDLQRYRRGLALLALLCSESDQEAIAAFEAALGHDEPQLRSLALTVVSYAPWPELRASLERLRDTDPVDGLRAAAAQILGALYP